MISARGQGGKQMQILKEKIVRYETDGSIVKGYDAGELIRCKDCKLYRTPMPEETYCSITGFGVDDNDFCSYAERRTDDSISH